MHNTPDPPKHPQTLTLSAAKGAPRVRQTARWNQYSTCTAGLFRSQVCLPCLLWTHSTAWWIVIDLIQSGCWDLTDRKHFLLSTWWRKSMVHFNYGQLCICILKPFGASLVDSDLLPNFCRRWISWRKPGQRHVHQTGWCSSVVEVSWAAVWSE